MIGVHELSNVSSEECIQCIQDSCNKKHAIENVLDLFKNRSLEMRDAEWKRVTKCIFHDSVQVSLDNKLVFIIACKSPESAQQWAAKIRILKIQDRQHWGEGLLIDWVTGIGWCTADRLTRLSEV